MGIGWAKKKMDKTKEQLYVCPGVKLAEPITMEAAPSWCEILVKAITVMLIVFGSIGAFLSCFEISYYVPVVAIGLFFVALYFAWIYQSRKNWVKDVGYIVYFIFFLLGIYAFSRYINSGFYAIMNIVYEEASSYFDMSATREFAETISNRDVTITVVALFLGSVSVIILNIYLSIYMSLAMAVGISVPLMMAPLFLELEPDSFYVIMLLAGLFAVVVFKANGHYRVLKTGEQFGYKKKQQMLTKASYSLSAKLIGQMILVMLAVCLMVISVCNVVYPKDNFVYRYQKSSLKAKVEEPLGNVLLLGFASMFNMYGSTSGMSHGQLGGVGTIRSDFMPDLYVIYTPYSYEPVYLKAFTGDFYTGYSWEKAPDGLFGNHVGGETYGTMKIYNAGADASFAYMPYYTKTDDADLKAYQTEDGLQRMETATYTYYPYNESRQEEEVSIAYLDVPDENYQVIASFCEEAGFGGSEEEIINQVIAYFQEEIPYTLNPGRTPKDEDFVNYFLEDNRKGYCAHFATAATLIFRYYGIPARYVEGYAFTYSNVMDAKLLEEADYPYEDYFHGESELGKTAVVEVEVNDSQAHAWVEVYLDDNWKVVEVTPAAEEEIEDFWSIFDNWLNDNEEDAGDAIQGIAFSTDQMKWLWMLPVILICGTCCYWIGRLVWIKGKRFVSYHGKDSLLNVIAYYKYLCDYMRIVDSRFAALNSHYEQIARMVPELDENDRRVLAERMEELSYSTNPKLDDIQELKNRLRTIMSSIQKQVPWQLRLYAFWHI